MFNIGPFELLIVFALPFSGVIAAIYLILALRNVTRGAPPTHR